MTIAFAALTSRNLLYTYLWSGLDRTMRSVPPIDVILHSLLYFIFLATRRNIDTQRWTRNENKILSRTAPSFPRVNHRKDCMGLMLGAEDFRLRQKQDDQRIRETHDTDPH